MPVASDGRREKNAEERALFRAAKEILANSEPQIGLGIRPSETVRHCSVHRNASDDETGMTVLMPGTSSTASAWTARCACGSTLRRARVQSRGSRSSKARFTAAPAALVTPRAYSSDDEGVEYHDYWKSDKEHRSSWTTRESTQAAKGVDYLVELGRQSENMNTAVGARYGVVDDVFAGKNNSKFNLGADSDIASGKLRFTMERSFNNLVGEFHVPKQFVDRVALHIAKNLLMDSTNPGVGENALGLTRVPLILGIWGSKGCGKTFNLELACKALGVHPVVMSAGELEDEWAGEPGRLIRRRYRHAAEIMKVRGKATCLIINDIDAGVGWFKQTQATVNTQMVMGTLMNICDHPNFVSNEEDDEIHAYRDDEYIRRVPIIITGNDLSTLYRFSVTGAWTNSIGRRPEKMYATWYTRCIGMTTCPEPPWSDWCKLTPTNRWISSAPFEVGCTTKPLLVGRTPFRVNPTR